MSLLLTGSFGKPYQELLSHFFAAVVKCFAVAWLCQELVDQCASSELLAGGG